jgi:hypothetical protein
MTLRLPAAVVSLVGLLATSLVTAAPATAAPVLPDKACTIESFSPARLTMGLVRTPKVTTFTVKTSGCHLTDWTLEGNPFYVFHASPQWPFQPLFNDEAGPREVTIVATNGDHLTDNRVFADGFSLLRRTEWMVGTVNAAPEPVKAGKAITIKGRLRVVDWDVARYVVYAHRPVSVQFRTGSAAYKTVKTTTTTSTGWVDTTVTAKATGDWRIVYWGSKVSASATSVGDNVKVTK